MEFELFRPKKKKSLRSPLRIYTHRKKKRERVVLSIFMILVINLNVNQIEI